jgi:TM2 domain-containing membrane protein YozV
MDREGVDMEGQALSKSEVKPPLRPMVTSHTVASNTPQIQTNTAYILWFLCALGICGGQRFYSGKIASGLLYLFTVGLFGFGQLLDLLLIPDMVEKRNIYLRGLYAKNLDLSNPQPAITLNLGEILQPQPPLEPPAAVSPMHKLLRIAHEQGGMLSPAQVALFTELDPEAVHNLLQEAQKYGYAEVCNDPQTGAVRYRFDL